MNDCTVHSLFPTPVYITQFKRDEKLEKFLKNVEVADKFKNGEYIKSDNVKNFGLHSKDIKILRMKECSELRTFILHHAKVLGNKVLGFDADDYVDTISWVSIKVPGSHHTPHVHPNSVISGVYYFDSNLESTPISFADTTRQPLRTYSLSPRKNLESKSAFAVESATFSLNLGDVILFPSYLKHAVQYNQTNENRYSLAFNIIPKYSSGMYDDLTLFEYKDAL